MIKHRGQSQWHPKAHINSEHTTSWAIRKSYGSRAAIIPVLTVGAFMFWQFPTCFRDPADVFCVSVRCIELARAILFALRCPVVEVFTYLRPTHESAYTLSRHNAREIWAHDPPVARIPMATWIKRAYCSENGLVASRIRRSIAIVSILRYSHEIYIRVSWKERS